MRNFATIFAVLGAAMINTAFAGPAEEAAGRQMFNNCVACHAIKPGVRGFGPDLHGVVGRAAAALPTFEYSEALRKSNIIWTEDNLRAWMAGNDILVPGTRMRHVSISDPAEQDYLIAFLKTLKGPELDHAKKAEVLLARAIKKLNDDGPEAAFAAFDQHSGDFVMGELYVFVFDMHGKYLASGANPQLVGQDANGLTDAQGKYLVREMIDVASKSGSGTVSYVWLNRVDNKVETKRSIIRRVGDYIVGVGYYLN